MPGVFGPTNFRRNTRPLACTGTGHRERPPVRHAGSPNPIGIGDRHGVLSASGVVGVYPVASGLLVGEDRSPSASGHRFGSPLRADPAQVDHRAHLRDLTDRLMVEIAAALCGQEYTDHYAGLVRA